MGVKVCVAVNTREKSISKLLLEDPNGGFSALTSVKDKMVTDDHGYIWDVARAPVYLSNNWLILSLKCRTGTTSKKKTGTGGESGNLTITLINGATSTPTTASVPYVDDDADD
jgi:hypothetical protein